MEINKHICFRDYKVPELIHYLKEHNISYDSGELLSALDIYESDPHWRFIGDYVSKNKLSCLSETVFSNNELDNANWLTVRSTWHNGYPQPEDDYKYEDITYDGTHCRECGTGLIQTDSFRIKKQPKWGKRHFMMLNWVEDELFLDETAKEILKKQNYPGISFLEVKNKSGKEVFPDVFQLIIPVLQQKGIIENQIGIREVLICPKCGTKRYHPNGIGMLQFKKGTFDNAPDIVKTAESFGWGHSASPEIVVSQKVRQLLISNHLERGLVFEPIDLVD